MLVATSPPNVLSHTAGESTVINLNRDFEICGSIVTEKNKIVNNFVNKYAFAYTNDEAVPLKIGFHKVYVIVFVSGDWNRCCYNVYILGKKIVYVCND